MDNKFNQKNTFEYTYSAKRQSEVEAIRNKYLPNEEDKLEQLKKLDKSVERPGSICALVLGIAGILIMGAGMSMCMAGHKLLMIPGIIVGIMGIAIAAATYPVYNKITTKRREEMAPQIIALSEELM